MKKYISVIVLFTMALAANAQQTNRTAKGATYTIFAKNTGEKIKMDDIITFNIEQRTDKDSILFSTYKMGRPVQTRVKASQGMMDLMDVFVLLGAGDSALVKMPIDSLFKGQEGSMPPFLSKGGNINTMLKVEKVQSMQAYMAERAAELEKLKIAEATEAGEYIAAKKLNLITTASGLKYTVTTSSTKPKPRNGDTVMVNYTGSTLAGKVFDSSIQAEAQKAGINQPGREYKPYPVILGARGVIKGWEEALLLLNEGAKAKLLIPSHLAYGEQGSGADIKPYTTLVFDIELVKVNRAKQVAPAVIKPAAKKPAAKKPATKKPVAKKPTVQKTAPGKKKN